MAVYALKDLLPLYGAVNSQGRCLSVRPASPAQSDGSASMVARGMSGSGNVPLCRHRRATGLACLHVMGVCCVYGMFLNATWMQNGCNLYVPCLHRGCNIHATCARIHVTDRHRVRGLRSLMCVACVPNACLTNDEHMSGTGLTLV